MRTLVVLLAIVVGGHMAMGQNGSTDVQTQIDELKKQSELLDAEKARLDAEKAKIEASKALLAAQQSEDPTLMATQKGAAAAKAQKELVDAQKNLLEALRGLEKAQERVDKRLDDLKNQKAIADAKKDLANAETDAAKAQWFGTVTGGSFSGAVELKERTGIAEANLLASHAIRAAAVRIATTVNGETIPGNKPIYLFSVKDFPNFQRLLTFRFRMELVKQAYQAAGITEAREVLEVPAPAMISAGLDAFSKLLGFFKSDYTIGGLEIKPDDSQVLFAVAGAFGRREVHVPAIYNPGTHVTGVKQVTEQLAALVALRAKADSELKLLSARMEAWEKGTEDEKKNAVAAKPKLEQLQGVIALHDSFVSSLTAPDANGNLPIATMAQELAIDDALRSNGLVLLVKLENAGGGYYVKKNLLTGLFGMPLYHMGGSTLSYVLLEGNTGKVLASEVVPVHGGFIKAGKVAEELAKQPAQAPAKALAVGLAD
jgi:hypothetical protein